jgi:hypothetical protein
MNVVFFMLMAWWIVPAGLSLFVFILFILRWAYSTGMYPEYSPKKTLIVVKFNATSLAR